MPGRAERRAARAPVPVGRLEFFAGPAGFRAWLEAHHATAQELWVGFYKKHAGRPGITPSEAIDEALCFGWIDGVRRTIDAERYMNRFTPRRPGSNWSAVNVRRAEALIRQRRMRPPGRAAFAARTQAGGFDWRAQRDAARLEPVLEQRFQADRAAWRFFEAQPAGYRQNAIWYVTSAKRMATRERRLDVLIALSRAGQRLDPMTSRKADEIED